MKVRAAAVCCTMFVHAPVLARAIGRRIIFVTRMLIRSGWKGAIPCFPSALVQAVAGNASLTVSYTFTAIVLHRTDVADYTFDARCGENSNCGGACQVEARHSFCRVSAGVLQS